MIALKVLGLEAIGPPEMPSDEVAILMSSFDQNPRLAGNAHG